MDKRGCFTRNKSQWIKAGLKFKWVLQWSKISRYCQSQSPNLSQEYWNLFQGQPQLREQQPGEQQHREQQLREQQHWEQQPREKQLGEQQQLGEQYQSEEKQLWRNQNGRNLQLTFLSSTALSLELWKTRGRGHYMAKKEDYSYEICTHLVSVSYYVSLFSVRYQATNVSSSFRCVTVKQMLV